MRHRSSRPLLDLLLGRGSTRSLRRRAVLAVAAVATSGTVAAVALTGHDAGHRPAGGGTTTAAEGPPTTAAPSAATPDLSRSVRPSRAAERLARPHPAAATPTGGSSPTGGLTSPLTRLPVPSLAPSLVPAPAGHPSGAAPRASSQPSGTTGRQSAAAPTPSGSGGSPSPSTPSLPPVDGTAPQTVLTTLSGDLHDWTVAVSADEPATFECALDGSGYRPCAATTTFGNLGGGVHTLLARATDTAGNTDPTPAALTVRLTGLDVAR